MTVEYALVGYSHAITCQLDRILPARSVVVIEEPHVISARNVLAETADIASVAGIVSAPTQSEVDIERIADIVGRPPHLRAVIPTVEYGVVAAAALAEAWDLPGSGVQAARILRNKLRLRKAAAAAGIAQPEWAEATGPEDVAAFRDTHGGRCVLKPANRQASLGVQLLEADDDVEAAWKHTTVADEPRIRARYLTDARYMTEARLIGSEVSVEALVRDGDPVFFNATAKTVAPGRYPVELGHTVPASVPASIRQRLEAETRSLISCTGFYDGIIHAEWILVDGVPHLIECAGRAPGDYINDLIGLAYDCDVFTDLVAVLDAGRPEIPKRTAHRAAAIRFLTVPPGTVTAIEDANRPEDYEQLRIGAELGDEVAELTNSWRRIGHAITIGADADEAAVHAREAADRVTVTTARSGAGDV